MVLEEDSQSQLPDIPAKAGGKKGVYLFLTAAAAVVLAVVRWTLFSNLSFKSGLNGNPFYMFYLLFPLELLWLLLFLVVSLTSLIVTARALIAFFKTHQWNGKNALLAAAPLLILSSIFINFIIRQPGAVYFLRGYEKWVENNVDIPAIQQWLVALPPEYSEERYFEAEDFSEPLPEAIQKLEPYHMEFGEFQEARRFVRFEWGSALGHWGIQIGLPDMETPEGEECIKHSNYDYEYRRPIQPGVYIFDRG